ncbi:hypothetical protein DUNSADRAFT_7750 [Dunaliella salina]|uniref:Mitochondrial cardiolipin hydrolase n=1 Tax=Dunaliella salina TaxID=3046 RepID=A0ABQ7GL03_DUNSA|nr:hypothetical protein DUNSADRAFT_7750 [Dunaliella salina]|eukprot:KAF5835208.1 hypothetical protein DUNSADRAFT_7750 [Dunaliella salina]
MGDWVTVTKGSQACPTASQVTPAPKAAVCEVLFFPDDALPCRFMGNCRRNNCDKAHQATSLSRMLDFLRSAQRSLDICVFTITCDEIADVLFDAHKRGVQVRIISDDDQMASNGSDVARLRRAGIAAKIDNSKAHMHNKFAIIDQRLLMNGSFNWTRQAAIGNNENVVVQDTPQLVSDFGKYFESLWKQFQGI